MTTQVTLSIPDEVLEKATHLANIMGQPVDDFLAEAIRSYLWDLDTKAGWEGFPKHIREQFERGIK